MVSSTSLYSPTRQQTQMENSITPLQLRVMYRTNALTLQGLTISTAPSHQRVAQSVSHLEDLPNLCSASNERIWKHTLFFLLFFCYETKITTVYFISPLRRTTLGPGDSASIVNDTQQKHLDSRLRLANPSDLSFPLYSMLMFLFYCILAFRPLHSKD